MPERRACLQHAQSFWTTFTHTLTSLTSTFPVFQYTSPHIKRPPAPSHNMRVDARHRRPAAAPRDLARASPALFANKVLTHHIHHRKSTPPLRKRPLAQKALRALRPWLGHAGSTKFGRPRKTQAFFGAPELRPRAGVVRKPPCPALFQYILVLSPRADARRASKILNN